MLEMHLLLILIRKWGGKMESTFLDDLLGFVNEAEEESLQISNDENFTIQSADQANYFARKLREIRVEQQQVTETAKEQIEIYKARVEEWERKTLSPLQYEEDRLVNMLKFFAETQLNGSTRKSIKLVEGTLQFRSQQPSYEYDDEVLLDYVERKAPAYKVIKSSVDKKELKKAIKLKDGLPYLGDEIVPGITIEQRPDSFDVK